MDFSYVRPLYDIRLKQDLYSFKAYITCKFLSLVIIELWAFLCPRTDLEFHKIPAHNFTFRVTFLIMFGLDYSRIFKYH